MYEELIESLREKASRLYYDGWIETPDMMPRFKQKPEET